MRAACWPPPCTAPNAASGWKPYRGRRPRSTRRRATARSRRAAVSRKPAASSGCRPPCKWGTGSQDASWRNALKSWQRRSGGATQGKRFIRRDDLSAETWVSPLFDLGRPDNLLGLMRVERARADGPALRQNLHGEQLGIDFRFEGPGRAHHARRAVVGFHGFVRPKGHIPDIGLRHSCITRNASESFIWCQRLERILPSTEIGMVTSGDYR